MVEIGFIWDGLEYEWQRKYDLCKEYKELYGIVPTTSVEYDGEKIGWWINTQKKSATEGKLSIKRIELLKELGLNIEKYLVA